MAFDAMRALDRMLEADSVDCGDEDSCAPDAAVLVLVCGDDADDYVLVKADDEDEADAAMRIAAERLAAAIGCALVPLASNDEAEA
jgi:hypothetical protein